MAWYTSGRLWCFVGGVGATLIGGLVAKAPKTREIAVKVVSKGMEAQQFCTENVQTLKEDAEDLAAEARKKAKLEAELADKRAAMEKRIREQVEAEMAAEEEKAAEQAKKAEGDED